VSGIEPGRVLVTGATGFVGTELVPRLVAGGWEVHALARASSDRSPLDGVRVTWHTGDVTDADAVRRALAAAGPDAAVVHGAALISYRTRDREEQQRVNLGGTAHVVDACRAEGARRLLLVSSVVAVGHSPDARSVLDEDAVWNGADSGCDYMITKRRAEELALAAADELDVLAVNPGAIFGGAHGRSNTTTFLKRIAAGRAGPAAPPGSLSAVGLRDVAGGIVLALERGVRGRRYLLTERNATHAELFELVASAVGARAPRRTAPRPLWSAVVGAASLADRVRPLELATPQALRLLGLHFRFDSSRARTELGWEPEPFEEVLARSAAELRGDGRAGTR
jgi:nucleoside-diphosphate-sugar epimerase